MRRLRDAAGKKDAVEMNEKRCCREKGCCRELEMLKGKKKKYGDE